MKFPIILFAVSMSLAVPGCATINAWWQQFEANPLEQVEVFEQGAQVAVSDATVAFNTVLPFLPASTQVQAQTAFNNTLVTVNHALAALNDAVQAAVAAQTANPDFTALITDVENAIAQIIAVVDQYNAAPPAPPSATAAYGQRPTDPSGLADAKSILTSLKTHFGAKVVAATKK
jgi:hypothetical protein